MENVNVKEMVLNSDEGQYDDVLMEKNLARTKGILIGAAFVGAGWLATIAYKKLKKRKNETVETEEYVD